MSDEKKIEKRGGNALWEKFLAEANGDIAEAKDLQYQYWREVSRNRTSHFECDHEPSRAARLKCRRDRQKAIDNAVAE